MLNEAAPPPDFKGLISCCVVEKKDENLRCSVGFGELPPDSTGCGASASVRSDLIPFKSIRPFPLAAALSTAGRRPPENYASVLFWTARLNTPPQSSTKHPVRHGKLRAKKK